MDDTLAQAQPRTVAGRNGGTLQPITSANAADMARKRWDKYRRKAAERILGAAQDIDATVKDAGDAWGLLNARLFVEQMDKPRGDDVAQLGRNMGALPTQYDKQQDTATAQQYIQLGADALALLVQVAQAQAARVAHDAGGAGGGGG